MVIKGFSASRIIFAALACIAASLPAQDIEGTILIRRKLTKRSVTPSVSIYQRGVAVEPGKTAGEDPLDFERSRVVIYLEGPGPSSPATPKMEQVNRRFLPDLLAISIGSTVSFPNMDPIFHNVFSLSKAKAFDLGNYDKGDTRTVVFTKPGVVYVNCHLHPNMAATIVVTPNQWYARSDAAGAYRIPDVPPGEYMIVAWHKAAGFFRKEVTVAPGRNAAVDFFIPIGDEPQKAALKGASVGIAEIR